MNFLFLENSGKFLTSWGTTSVARRTLFLAVNGTRCVSQFFITRYLYFHSTWVYRQEYWLGIWDSVPDRRRSGFLFDYRRQISVKRSLLSNGERCWIGRVMRITSCRCSECRETHFSFSISKLWVKRRCNF